ncbi:hypothetical protein A1O1_03368 [Capronia coronata CBS 617.96]|uniref:Transcription factor domain-containing protein n=1 Tax=Capronia coronata CBS 617.96 TaxID=1182541 RepID=W9Z6X4_9EURO|nr:uncharacterized protein A1O1_03368 [Capronia coronata CBS 617.96]EXJ90269.1 hypothetical protein A1O1_03368 [Capronia coronata CBS 617.96]
MDPGPGQFNHNGGLADVDNGEIRAELYHPVVSSSRHQAVYVTALLTCDNPLTRPRCQCYNLQNPQMMNLVHLASAMLLGLALNRPPQPSVWRTACTFLDAHKVLHGTSFKEGARTTDERRAALAVYYFTSRLPCCEPLRWNPYLDECCDVLTAATEYSTDVYLVHSIRIQRIVDKYLSPGCLSLTGFGGRLPIRTYVKCFEDDFESYERTLPPELKESSFAQMYKQSALIILYEPVLTMERDEAIQKAEALHACVEHIRLFYDSFAAQPPGSLQLLPFLEWLPVLYAHLVLARLSFLVADGWDLQCFRSSSMSFSAVADRLMAQLQSAAQQSLVQSQQSSEIPVCFSHYIDKLRLWKKWYENKLKTEVEVQPSTTPDVGAAFSAYDFSVEGFFGGFEDLVGQDFIGDWNSSFQD